MCHPRSEGLGELVHCLCKVPSVNKEIDESQFDNKWINEMERIETPSPSAPFWLVWIKNDHNFSRLGKHLHLLGTTLFVLCLFQCSSTFQSVPIRSDWLRSVSKFLKRFLCRPDHSPRLSFQSSLRAASSKTTSQLYSWHPVFKESFGKSIQMYTQIFGYAQMHVRIYIYIYRSISKYIHNTRAAKYHTAHSCTKCQECQYTEKQSKHEWLLQRHVIA